MLLKGHFMLSATITLKSRKNLKAYKLNNLFIIVLFTFHSWRLSYSYKYEKTVQIFISNRIYQYL
ncbi:hypothetical protein CZ814_02476 [Photobacterium toruni]|uniref:Uncharacterized protein n=1 Tax=Photobacterium toruni TaxID=1935446 RepID=A0A1T4TU60_9GAMM|nr:hypothetical protein CZ814_02476 [Photobacterium toruni]